MLKTLPTKKRTFIANPVFNPVRCIRTKKLHPKTHSTTTTAVFFPKKTSTQTIKVGIQNQLNLIGGWTSHFKNASQNGSFPQGKNKICLKPPPSEYIEFNVCVFIWKCFLMLCGSANLLGIFAKWWCTILENSTLSHKHLGETWSHKHLGESSTVSRKHPVKVGKFQQLEWSCEWHVGTGFYL